MEFAQHAGFRTGPIRTGRSEYQAKQFKPCSSSEVPACARLIHFVFVIRQSGLVSRVVRKIPRELADPCGPRGGSRCTSAPRLVAALIGAAVVLRSAPSTQSDPITGPWESLGGEMWLLPNLDQATVVVPDRPRETYASVAARHIRAARPAGRAGLLRQVFRAVRGRVSGDSADL